MSQRRPLRARVAAAAEAAAELIGRSFPQVNEAMAARLVESACCPR